METATLLKKDTQLYLLSGDDFHNHNLQPNDQAYHWKSKEMVIVQSFNEKTADWLCSDGTHRDSYKLKKVLAHDWEITLSDSDARKISYVNILKFAQNFVAMSYPEIDLKTVGGYQKGMIDGIILFYPEIVERLNIENNCTYPVTYEKEKDSYIVKLKDQE